MQKAFQSLATKAIHDISGTEVIKILDVGCGYSLRFDLPDNACMVGLDISQEQLKKNSIVDKKVCGDIQNFNFMPSSFDVTVCFCVLEHLSRPEDALINITKGLREGGIIVIVVPYLFSVITLLTKITPLCLHRWVYRHIRGFKEAGTSTMPIFKTYLKLSISPGKLKDFAVRNNLSIEFSHLHKTKFNAVNKFYKAIWAVFIGALQFFSLGKVVEAAEYYLILRKRIAH
ncbi:MAG: class I SAM-dependent methyltransferase [Candidatus Omnitrophica bacterium]|nr:class I SAM-dependent methyltransferase [Candidatus Omnitrophota bacterium]